MKAILIDPVTRTVTTVEHDGTLDSTYNLLGCSMIESPVRYENGDAMYCDEEAWLNVDENPLAGFKYPDYLYGILGKALIVGSNDEGEDDDCKSTVEEIAKDITWLDDAEMRKQGKEMRII